MYDVIHFILQELKNSTSLVLVAFTVMSAVLICAFLICKRETRSFPWKKAILLLLLAGCTGIMVYATKFRQGEYRAVNLHLFRTWREAWNNYTVDHWANVLLNIVLFFPIGFLLPPLAKVFKKWYITLPVCLGVSLLLETIQYLLSCGVFDVDDLFTNTLGALIGYLLCMSVLSIKKSIRGALLNSGLFLCLIAAISSIFIVYEVKEYGNLPMAPAYRIDTSKVLWRLECPVPQESASGSVYRTQPRTLEDCDAFAEAFKQAIGTEYDTVSYCQNGAYYMDHGLDENGAHFLYVNYKDPGYTYSHVSQNDPIWADAERHEVEDALSAYPLPVPNCAEFSADGDGWYSFAVDQYIQDTGMIDGILRCRYGTDRKIYEIENGLCLYTYYGEAKIISAYSAYTHLCAGRFYDGGIFEREDPSVVLVTDCCLGYEIDTKGFYQPVYYFDVASEDGTYQNKIMIPAIR
ncbi:MAG: VanZ family protein [Oscillospiraceae bacterium]|nr:VanZ family protein [Oscillospiraceae bacterium]